MKLLLSKFGMAYGMFLIGKGALIILAADIIYSIANMFNQLLFWGSNIVGAIEGKIEDMVITEGIFTFSLGAMYLTAGYLQDTNFFFTSFFAFNLSMILLHSMLIYTGRNKVTDNIWNIIELFVVLIIFIYLKMNENKTSKTKTSTVDPKESKKEK